METGVKLMNVSAINGDLTNLMKQIGTRSEQPESSAKADNRDEQRSSGSFSRVLTRAKSVSVNSDPVRPVTGHGIPNNARSHQLAAHDVTVRTSNTNTGAAVSSDNNVNSAKSAIKDVLETLSNKLGVDLGDKGSNVVTNLDLENPDQNTVDQLAEILSAMKGISGVLDNASANNSSLLVNGKMMNPSELLDLEKTLRVSTFKLEVAINSVGISSAVNQQVADKLGQPTTGGLPVAVDPSTLSMPKSQINQLFANAIDVSEERIQSVVEKLKQLSSGGNAQSALASSGQGIAADSLKLTVGTDEKKSAVDAVKELDNGVLRTAIANGASSSGSNDSGDTNSGTSQQSSQPTPDQILPVKLSVSAIQIKPAAAEKSSTSDQISGVSHGSVRTQIDIQASSLTKTSSTLSNFDDSVIRQLSEKISTAVRQGSNEVRVQLRPESLGEVRVAIKVEGDVVTARITVENQQVKQIVESNLQHLRDSLSEHNLSTANVSVDIGNNGQGRFDGFSADGSGKSPGSSKDPMDGTATGADSQSVNEPVTALGSDTGRRYGNNSVEIYL